ncbi:hypothetical protein [Syntrophotalea acetylenivorans]|uniref:hypothetical protein n=1 Tax=Syntrophotalea acetylenivorans TaxID=1842532 RepID=UPI000A6CD643|nr:hypothetical protein [Syntrophotalea acetylenivorans]
MKILAHIIPQAQKNTKQPHGIQYSSFYNKGKKALQSGGKSLSAVAKSIEVLVSHGFICKLTSKMLKLMVHVL